MPTWRPPSTQDERSARTIRSMNKGTLDGRIVSAVPIRDHSDGSAVDDFTELDSNSTLLPYTDYFKPSTGGSLILKLTYAPYSLGDTLNTTTFHVYWNNMYQKEVSYTLTGNLLTLHDAGGLVRTGDTITVKYWYDPEYPLGEVIAPTSVLWRPDGPPTHWYVTDHLYTAAAAVAAHPTYLFPSSCSASSGNITLVSEPKSNFDGSEYYNYFSPAWVSAPVTGFEEDASFSASATIGSVELTHAEFEIETRPHGGWTLFNTGFGSAGEEMLARYVDLYGQAGITYDDFSDGDDFFNDTSYPIFTASMQSAGWNRGPGSSGMDFALWGNDTGGIPPSPFAQQPTGKYVDISGSIGDLTYGWSIDTPPYNTTTPPPFVTELGTEYLGGRMVFVPGLYGYFTHYNIEMFSGERSRYNPQMTLEIRDVQINMKLDDV